MTTWHVPVFYRHHPTLNSQSPRPGARQRAAAVARSRTHRPCFRHRLRSSDLGPAQLDSSRATHPPARNASSRHRTKNSLFEPVPRHLGCADRSCASVARPVYVRRRANAACGSAGAVRWHVPPSQLGHARSRMRQPFPVRTNPTASFHVAPAVPSKRDQVVRLKQGSEVHS